MISQPRRATGPALAPLDPLTRAQVEAAEWCLAVKRQAQVVADARRELEGSLAALEKVAERAEQAIAEVRAIETMRKP